MGQAATGAVLWGCWGCGILPAVASEAVLGAQSQPCDSPPQEEWDSAGALQPPAPRGCLRQHSGAPHRPFWGPGAVRPGQARLEAPRGRLHRHAPGTRSTVGLHIGSQGGFEEPSRGSATPPWPQLVRPRAGLGRGAQAPGSPTSPCSPCSALSADASEISPCRAGAASLELSDPVALPPAPTPRLLRAACAQRSSVGGKTRGQLPHSRDAAAVGTPFCLRPRASACQLLRGPAVPSRPDRDLCQIGCP